MVQHPTPQQPAAERAPSRSDAIIALIDRCLTDLGADGTTTAPRAEPAPLRR